MLRFALVLAMAAAACATNVQKCVSGGPLPLSTVVEGCQETPCRLPQLQDAVIHYTFIAPHDLPRLRAVATLHLRVGAIGLPVALDLGPAADACSALGDAGCPVAAGQPVHYTLRVPVHLAFPVGTSADLELQVEDASGALLCSRVPLQVAPP